MSAHNLSVREIQSGDVDLLVNYWLTADDDFLKGMGVDTQKLPGADEFSKQLNDQVSQPYDEKKSYCLIWLLNDNPVGHSNANKIVYAKEAFMHLHIWHAAERSMGLGTAFIQKTLPYYFNHLQLEKLCCEPYALNPSPNNTLKKIGFQFIKEYITTPGWLNFEQPVNLWELTREKFNTLRTN